MFTALFSQESLLFFIRTVEFALYRPYAKFPLYWMTNIWPVSVPSLIYSGVVVAFQSNACAPQAERIIKNTLDDDLKVFL